MSVFAVVGVFAAGCGSSPPPKPPTVVPTGEIRQAGKSVGVRVQLVNLLLPGGRSVPCAFFSRELGEAQGDVFSISCDWSKRSN